MSKVMTRVWTVRQSARRGMLAAVLVLLAASCHKSGNASNPDGGDGPVPDAPGMHDGVDRPDLMPDTQPDTGPSCPPAASKALGAACTCGAECASGFCADGVCCNVACQGACVSCNQPTHGGTCWPIAAMVPDPRGQCVDEGTASCGHDGTCDGVGGCARYLQDTPCLPAACSGVSKLNTAGTCDGLGTCRPPLVTSCHPFRCGNGACTTTCQTDLDCDTGIACVNNTCGPKQNGQTCTDASECASNHCVDGVCCESACTGACRTCALPMMPGKCVAVAAGNPDVRNICTDQKAASCGTNGKCDGSGGCQKYAVGTQCADETCSGNVYTAPSTCNTSGQCAAPEGQPCRPYVCNGSKCFTVCSTDAQCLTPNVCQMNSCGPKPDGASCSAASECASAFCEQGVCCHTACKGACTSCALQTSLGTCSNIATGATDTQGICVDQGQASCGTNGKCEAGACQKYGLGTSCKDPVCPSGTTMSTGASTCDGAGTCVTPATISCFPYQCGTNVCRNACTSNADCASPAVCINNACGLKPPGVPCADASECQLGFCAQGYCCQSACNSTCKSCGLTGSLGTCTNVAAGKGDPKQTCTDMGPTSCSTDGFCDGNGGCRLYDATTSCAAPTCPAGTSTATSVRLCDGKGACQAATSIPCAPYLCNGTTACKGACTSDADCLAPNICDPTTNLCGNKKRLGQACLTTADCLTNNYCVDGVCCSATACSTCQACNVSGSAGNCTNVPLGVAEPHSLCAANPPCGNTGACNGAGACQQASTGVSCGTASCAGSTFTPISHCNGSGGCAPATASSCGAYVCGTSACKTTCAADADCVAPFTCQASNCALKPNGLACANAAQCISGYCTDGVCCGSTACPLCQACNVNGNGSCAPIPAGVAAPANQCPASAPCGNTGACNGAGACQQAATTVACGTASCTGMTATPVSHCDGAGNCATPVTMTCVPYICGTNACKSSCSADTDCVTGFYCTGTNGTCQPKKSSGASCAAGHECGTGNCVDNVCCGVASCPTCQVCGAGGTCVNVSSGTTDPHARCTVTTTCGNTGACNGSGACSLASTSTSCGTASCTGFTYTPTSNCDGAGNCITPTNQTCVPYVCGGTTCRTNCSQQQHCTSGAYCTGPNGMCLLKKASGAACTDPIQCATGNCVDGVCCGVASCPTCQVCGAGGLCVNIASGTADAHGGCPLGGTCGNTGVCNGGGACQQGSTSVQCGNPACTGTTYTPPAFCSGSGTCANPGTQSCAPYLCGTNACRTTCSADTDCTTGNYCTGTNGSCLATKGLGATCGADHECSGGHCVDGVCCSSASCPTCQACSASGNGTCANVAANAAEPHSRCPMSTTCGNTGACNGSGACQQAATSVQCGSAACSGSTFTPAVFCSGSGTCGTPSTQSCAPYICGTNACKVSCNSDADCTTGNYCTGTGGSCAAKKGLGNTCGGDHECGSGHCTDGSCCTVGACPTCQSCGVSGTGSCANVTNGQSEPHGGCASNGTCGNTGLCVAGACQQASTSVQCGNASCTGSTLTNAAFCSGSGTCGTPSQQSCSPYICGTGACKTSCAMDTDCTTGNYCASGGTCAALKGLGAACGGNNQCSSGNCIDGACCNVSACSACQACNLNGLGTCSNVANGTAEPHGLCPAGGTCGNTGLCTGGACQQAPTSTMCQSATCSGSTFTPAAFCNGSGGCGSPSSQSCSPFLCTSSGCPGSCNANTDCVSGDYCTGPGGSCQPLLGNGQACTSSNQCSSTHCTEGFCCGDAACLSCLSCAVPGSQGTCTAVPNGGADPTGSCTDQGAASCGHDSKCNGSGGCRNYGSSTVCATTCADAMTLSQTFCDGAGTCGPGTAPMTCTNSCDAGPPAVCK